MGRFFEKVSFDEFKKYYGDNEKLYNDYMLPSRKTKHSAGYDFFAIEDFKINPGEIKKIPTGCCAKFGIGEVLMLFVRSSMGFKYNVRMCNQVGIVDSDYYHNPDNEGHMFIALQNEGDKIFEVRAGSAFAQGIFTKFLLTDDDNVSTRRVSGIGSTNKKEGK